MPADPVSQPLLADLVWRRVAPQRSHPAARGVQPRAVLMRLEQRPAVRLRLDLYALALQLAALLRDYTVDWLVQGAVANRPASLQTALAQEGAVFLLQPDAGEPVRKAAARDHVLQPARTLGGLAQRAEPG